MAAQPYDDPAARRAQPRAGRAEQPRGSHPEQPPQHGGHPEQQPPRSRSRQDTRTLGNQETIISDAPRRSRRRGSGEPPEPPGPPTKKDGGGRGGWRRFVPSWKIVVAGTVVLAAGLFGMIMVAYANTPVPTSAQSEATAQQSTIYYRDGKNEIARLGYKREIVPFAKMDEDVRNAAVAIENKTFWEDSGISVSGMVRSVYNTVTGQQLQGASTITQQMARGYYDGLSQEVSIQRKVKEIFVAVKLDESMSKEDILETYLNTINFGRAYGVEAAAKAYFPGKNITAAKLTPEQGAYLAARIQQPNWDHDSSALQWRFKEVIKNMAELWPDKYGNLPQTAKFPKTRASAGNDDLGGLNGYMVKQVLAELETRGLTEEEIKSGGYHIVSTFDRRLMKAAQTAVKSTMQAYNLGTEFHGGLAAVNPKNGRVLAFYGGDDYLTDPWNEPFQSTKQAASAFKPYVLAAWLQAGYSLKSYVPGNQTVPKELPGQQEGGIRNSHNVGVSVDVVKATAASVNTAYVSMAFKLPGQLDDVKNLVEAAGFNEKRMEDDVNEHHFQFAIGSALVTPVEQAAGYSIFANGGKYTKYHVVQEVRQNNKVAYPEQAVAKEVINPGVAADATIAMQAVLQPGGTAAGKGLGNRPAAGKTGTNNDEKEAWFVGYTPQISTAVGFYREQCVTKTGKVVAPQHSNCPIFRKGSKKYNNDNPYTRVKEVSLGFEGAGPPTIAWQKFMQMAHENLPVEQFPDRAEVGVPENIVPSPTPTPTPTQEDENPFGPDNPFDDGSDDCIIGCDGNDATVPDDDVSVDDGGTDDEFSETNPNDVGLAGQGSAPEPRASGAQPKTTRPEDQ
ncbi:membrane peptidoglycan carboxypeptidase [Nonomuraea thailandensis]|uniref:Membrane peptidoglycan carboxypeptidase n=1 Tax=Nonomuraea thailandensis TaxID=1188745 RepID=A0A9X2GQC7_9ACTN|nr:transglycosylase domain-containing protein [Nonomuraea thailandensis]MCP2363306.1 membrane peptidoglycan carboxypeptidase [Nonomuraea thailandensis]